MDVHFEDLVTGSDDEDSTCAIASIPLPQGLSTVSPQSVYGKLSSLDSYQLKPVVGNPHGPGQSRSV